MSRPRCDGCLHWEEEASERDGAGVCSALPPVPVAINDVGGETSCIESVWPETSAGSRCGMWSPDVIPEEPGPPEPED